MVHEHSISGRKSIWLHLGMTGAVIRRDPQNNSYRVLEKDEMTQLFNDYNDLLNVGLPENGGDWTISYPYQEGDCIFIDNLAIAHRASAAAHEGTKKRGLRILHRTTVEGMYPFQPAWKLPSHLNLHGPKPRQFGDKGYWRGGGIGFRWDANIHM